MINIEQVYEDICILKDLDYMPDRYNIILNLLEKREWEVLDYKISITDVTENPLDTVDLNAVDFNQDFKTVLIGVNESYKEMISNSDFSNHVFKYSLEVLVQKEI